MFHLNAKVRFCREVFDVKHRNPYDLSILFHVKHTAWITPYTGLEEMFHVEHWSRQFSRNEFHVSRLTILRDHIKRSGGFHSTWNSHGPAIL